MCGLEPCRLHGKAVDAGITGEVVKAGDISLDGDMWTGLVVAYTKDDLKNMPVNLYGKTVRVVVVDAGVTEPCSNCYWKVTAVDEEDLMALCHPCVHSKIHVDNFKAVTEVE